MASLPGIPDGVSLDQQPASTQERAPPPHQASPASISPMGDLFANSFQDKMNKDPELKAWDASRPPVGPSTAYPPPNPITKSPLASSNTIQRLRIEELRHFGLHVKSSRNNTITTVSSPEGARLKTYSGGICGFKGSRRSSYEAGYQCAVKAIEFVQTLMEKEPKLKVNLFVNGFGQGRDAMHKALVASEGDAVRRTITRVTDVTPMKIGGTRAKKKRRT